MKIDRWATLSMVACLGLAACASPAPYNRKAPTSELPPGGPPGAVYAPAYPPIDVVHGLWGGQSITPPAGLYTTVQSDLVGRTITDPNGFTFLTIYSVLADAVTGNPLYVVTSSSEFTDFLLIPIAVLHINSYTITVDANRDQLLALPRYSAIQLEQLYPRRLASAPPAPPPTIVPAAPPPSYPPPSYPPTEPLRVVAQGSVVGYPVIDSYGQPVGSVDSVATVPTTGEVRYAIIAGPNFGLGYFIAIPAANLRLVSNQVILNGSLSSWLQAPRYSRDQIRATFDTYGPR